MLLFLQGVNYEQLPVTIAPEFKALYNSATLVWREVQKLPLLTSMDRPAHALHGPPGRVAWLAGIQHCCFFALLAQLSRHEHC